MQASVESMDRVGRDDIMGTGGTGVKLSLVAQMDDMFRFTNSLIDCDEQSLINLMKKCEENRIRWLLTERQLIEEKDKNKRLEEEKNELQSNLKHVRFGFAKEVHNREEVLKQRNQLRDQLNAIKDFVLKEPSNSTNPETRDKVLSYLNLNQLETVIEDTNESMEGLDYDTTEDDILNDSPTDRSKRLSKRKSSECDVSPGKAKYANRRQTDGDRMAPKAVFDDTVDLDSPTAEGTGLLSEAQPRSAFNLNPNPIEDRFGPLSKSSPYMNLRSYNSKSRRFTETIGKNISPIFPNTPLEERKHTFQQKRAFRPVMCGPCGVRVSFLENYLCCTDCRAVCHTHCKGQVPLPCIRFRKPEAKNYEKALIADFAPQSRPSVPALIIHVCNEIEKRGLQEEGIYRKCSLDSDIRTLKEKILKSKSGIPILAQYDIHVLCGVIKQFLRELDEPIVTRILWRDFVRASDQENADEEKALIMQTVEELPTANRDSLAYIMVHLIRVSQAIGNLMNTGSLSKIFGPTIVGYSMTEPLRDVMFAENQKQINVMEALFRIPEDHWNGILTAIHSWETNRPDSPDRRRSSHRHLQTIQRGTLTPLRSTAQSKGSLSVRPLF